jgi:hypothetical protein
MATSHSGTHFQGPILGSNRSGAGLFEDLPHSSFGDVYGAYKVYTENFGQIIADATAFDELGAISTASAGVAANTLLNTAGGRLLINPGTAADTGWASIQFNAASSQATYVNNRFNIMPPLTASATATPADREIIVWGRIGLMSNATTWDGKALFGWFVTDTALLDLTTGVPAVAAGGGMGFHIGETGVISFVCDDAAITAAGTQIGTVGTLTANTAKWYEMGLRMKVTDFAAQTGNVDVYFGTDGSMQKVLSTRQSGTLPVVNAAVYSTTLAVVNGPTNLSDLRVDAILTANSRQLNN